MTTAVTHQVLCEAGDDVLYRFILDLVGGECVMQCHAAVKRAWNVDVRAVLEQLVFVQGGLQVMSDAVPAVPADACGF